MENNHLHEAYQYCQWLTYNHYENFPVASWLLPKEKRPFIAAIYAFARSADDFADEAKYRGKSLENLKWWREKLLACSTNGGASHPIFIALADAIRQCQLPVQLLDDLLTAFTMDVTKRRYANWEELATYCRYSANPVGRLVLHVFGIEDPKLQEFSDSICTGLQMANHWQDLAIDFIEKDRLYVPQDFLTHHGVTEEELRATQRSPPSENIQHLLKELVFSARLLFDQGEPLLQACSGRLRLELKLTLLGGRAILDKIEQVEYDVFRRRPVLSTGAKLKLLAHALLS